MDELQEKLNRKKEHDRERNRLYRLSHHEEILRKKKEYRERLKAKKKELLEQKSKEIIAKAVNDRLNDNPEEAEIELSMKKNGIKPEGILWRRQNLALIKEKIVEVEKWFNTPHGSLAYEGHEISESNKYQVECPICGAMDNDWEPRGGLCCDCWCRELEHFHIDRKQRK